MKIDKSTALFLVKVLFHYEQLIKNSLSDNVELDVAVRDVQRQLNDSILSDDECDKKVEDIDTNDEVQPGYDNIISISQLCDLPRMTVKYYDGKFKFEKTSNHLDLIEIFKPNNISYELNSHVKYIKRSGKKLYVLSKRDIPKISNVIDNHNYWDIYTVSKFPSDWIDTLECGKVYKCV